MPDRKFDALNVRVFGSVDEMAAAAAERVRHELVTLLERLSQVRTVFAAAASQEAFLAALTRDRGIDWGRVEVLQLDEYVGLRADDPRSLRAWLQRHLTGVVPVGRIHYMDSAAPDPAAEAERYGRVVRERRIDLALLGIGENGHLAFNDPHVADFDDPPAVRLVDIDETSRAQQVHDGAFAWLDEVPHTALTLNMAPLLSAGALSVVVPGASKAGAVAAALLGPISTACPASALRRHPAATLYLDREAFAAADEQLASTS